MYQHNPYLPARIAETYARELRAAAAEYRDAQEARRGRSHRSGRLRRLGRSVLSLFASIVTP
jgi:hypothetical protein